MIRAYYRLIVYISWAAFALVGLLLNLACLPCLLLPGRGRLGRPMRAVIGRLFDFWLGWLQVSGLMRLRRTGLDGLLGEGTVYVANHPSMIDVIPIMARIPNAVCILKRPLMRNPAIGPAANLAQYVAGGDAVDVVRLASDAVSAGQSILIFPEGTRTAPGRILEPLKPGFAVIAHRARAPVQLLLIRCSKGLVPRGRAWWRLPIELPLFMDITADRRWEHEPDRSPHALAASVEARMREVLGPADSPVSS